jgi:glutathione S-transferase
MITVWGKAISGNCWKVAQILRLTGQPFHWVETDSNAGATRTPEFLARNPNGKVPVVALDDGSVITESNAILLHFAEGTRWLPPPGLARTRVAEWLFFEQYSHEPYIAVARNLFSYLPRGDGFAARMAQCHERGAQALAVMQGRLATQDWLAGTGPTVADLALFAYTHVADEGGFDLAAYPAVAAWVARVAALPGMTTLPRPLSSPAPAPAAPPMPPAAPP